MTGCGGDQLLILDMEDALLDVLGNFELLRFQMGSSRKIEGPIDIAFVEGSVSTENDLARLKEIRDRSKCLVALGNCAINGCLQAGMAGGKSMDERRKRVYGEAEFDSKFVDSKGTGDYVTVDYRIPGCPVEKEEVVQAIVSLLMGDAPQEYTYPVCVECKLNEYPCLITERGLPCLGPMIRAGCNARCPGLGVECIGCRGPPIENSNVAKEYRMLLEKSFKREYILNRLAMFAGSTEARELVRKLREESK